jgi:hypothetical protein
MAPVDRKPESGLVEGCGVEHALQAAQRQAAAAVGHLFSAMAVRKCSKAEIGRCVTNLTRPPTSYERT